MIRRGARGASLLAGLALLAGGVEARDTPGRLRPAGCASTPSTCVAIDGGRVTVEARAATVREVLDQIALGSGFLIETADALSERISLDLDRLPLPEALDRILGGRGFVLRLVDPPSRAGRSPDALPGRLWVFPAGRRDDRPPSEIGDRALPGDPEAGAPGHPRGDPDPPAADASGASLARALAGNDARTRLGAIAEMAAAGDDRAASVLAAAALLDDRPEVREEAVSGLGTVGAGAVVPILEQALGDPDPGVRRAAVDALTDIGGDESARALALALFDEDASLREAAAHALGDVGGESAAGFLRQALADGEGRVRDAAADALETITGRPR